MPSRKSLKDTKKGKYLNKIKIILFVISIFLLDCDPGWRYVLKDPPSEISKETHILTLNELNFKINSYDFAMHTNMELKIITNKDESILYPTFAYFKSIHFDNIIHCPSNVYIQLTCNNFKKIKKQYRIYDLEKKDGNLDYDFNQWNENKISIQELDFIADTTRFKSKYIDKEEYLKPITLTKNDTLLVDFHFKSFGAYNRNRFFQTGKKSDFIMYYNIFKTDEPLCFTFNYK